MAVVAPGSRDRVPGELADEETAPHLEQSSSLPV
jgi:hypothetical protein